MLRVDTESSQDISKEIEKKIFNKFVSLLKQTNIVVISDYRKGMLTKNLLSKIIKTAKEKKKNCHC